MKLGCLSHITGNDGGRQTLVHAVNALVLALPGGIRMRTRRCLCTQFGFHGRRRIHSHISSCIRQQQYWLHRVRSSDLASLVKVRCPRSDNDHRPPERGIHPHFIIRSEKKLKISEDPFRARMDGDTYVHAIVTTDPWQPSPSGEPTSRHPIR